MYILIIQHLLNRIFLYNITLCKPKSLNNKSITLHNLYHNTTKTTLKKAQNSFLRFLLTAEIFHNFLNFSENFVKFELKYRKILFLSRSSTQ